MADAKSRARLIPIQKFWCGIDDPNMTLENSDHIRAMFEGVPAMAERLAKTCLPTADIESRLTRLAQRKIRLTTTLSNCLAEISLDVVRSLVKRSFDVALPAYNSLSRSPSFPVRDIWSSDSQVFLACMSSAYLPHS